MAYQYQLYGLKISSTIKLNKLPYTTFTSKADIFIKKEKLRRPAKGKAQMLYKPFSVVGNNFFYLDVKGIARYKVANKHTVIVDKYKNATWQEVVLFLLDSVLESVLIFHEKFILKASAVSYKNKAYLFCGNNGVGKSALAASLHHKEIKIIEDNKCLLQWDSTNSCFVIKNQYAYAALWADVDCWETNKKVQELNAARAGIQKYEYDIEPIVEKKAIRVKKIYSLQEVNTVDSIKRIEIKGLQKVGVLRKFIPMHHLIALSGKDKTYFQFLNLLSQNVEFMHLKRARSTSLEKFAAFVRKEIHNQAIS